MKKPLIRITDHALIRYLERVEGLDCERMRRELGARVDAAYRQGACGVVIEGFSVRIIAENDGLIATTILDGTLGQPKAHRKRRHR